MVTTRMKDYGEPPPPKQRERKPVVPPCTEFTLFPKLPCELRLMIWQASMTPRLVAVGPKGLGHPRSHHSTKILPALLSVNKDSRYCALRHYTLRFTITLTVDKTGQHGWDCPKFQGTTYHANVVMCPDDTLGLLGWETLDLGHRTRFRVKSANGEGPWENCPTSAGAQPEVKKVAFLGSDIAFNRKIVHDLNSVVSWNLDSILHTSSTHVRKWGSHCCLWLSLPHAPHSKGVILVQSRNFNGSFANWAQRLMYRARHGALPLWRGSPDILAFQLGKKPETISRPSDYVPAESVQDLYAVLPDRFVSNILGDFYASREWKWSVRYPDRRGF